MNLPKLLTAEGVHVPEKVFSIKLQRKSYVVEMKEIISWLEESGEGTVQQDYVTPLARKTTKHKLSREGNGGGW